MTKPPTVMGEAHDIDLIRRSRLFDATYYLANQADVAAAGVDPLLHYVRYGARENRNPHPEFDGVYYSTLYPEVGAANPLAHYIREGAARGWLTRSGMAGPGPQPHPDALADDVPAYLKDLIGRDRLMGVHLEITSTCNLRCIYCAVSQPDYTGTTMAHAQFLELHDTLAAMGVSRVCINGHGETTSVPGWQDYARHLIGVGMDVRIISNFAREFSDDEVEILSRFQSITISIDTLDRQLLKELRRQVDVRTIILNQVRVQAAALRRGARTPGIGWSIVLCDQNFPGLTDLVAAGLALGVRQFSCCNMTKYPDLPGIRNVYPLPSLPADERQNAIAEIGRAGELARRHGAAFSINDDLMGIIGNPDADGGRAANGQCARLPTVGETRRCLDPWVFALIKANGDVLPCCWQNPIGNSNEAT
ncbi:MAG TPA: radical SAM protein, partial [Patescibacteria group bacterium]|nr:radical SAM protein [Patescibacteria group bacterium]